MVDPVDDRRAPTGAGVRTPLRFGARRAGGRGRAAIMAIVNRTPDSFYDRGATFGFDAAHRVTIADVVGEVVAELDARARNAAAAGVPTGGIMIDPTHDFGKNTWHGLPLVRETPRLVDTGWPVLMSFSRKDFIGEMLDLPPAERLEGTLAATAVAAWSGAQVFRAHDVAATRRTLETVGGVTGTRRPARAIRGLA